MRGIADQRGLSELVTEASRALARLDAERLEELAHSCRLLNGDSTRSGTPDSVEIAQQAREAAAKMAVFGRVIEATRTNLSLMHRLRELRMTQLEYGENSGRENRAYQSAEAGCGDD